MKNLLLFMFIIGLIIACSPEKKENNDGGWDVKVSGKIGFPTPGSVIVIQKLQDEGQGEMDTIELADNYTYEKTMHLTAPGYYQLNFFNKQFVNVILSKSNLEVNVDGNNPSGFAEVKGSPDQAVIGKVQTIIQNAQNSPEAN